MALHLPRVIRYAIPGVLALLGWWVYCHRKKRASCHDEQETAIEEVPEDGASPEPEACVSRRQLFSSGEECSENETSTPLLSAGLLPPHLCQAQERLDLSEDLADLSVMTVPYSALEDDSGKLDSIGSAEESSVPASVSLPLISKTAECPSSTAVSLRQGSSCAANQEQWPSATLPHESLGITEISRAEQSDGSSFKLPKESQMAEVVLPNTSSVTALCLGLEKEADAPQAFLSNEAEVVSSHKDSAVNALPDSLEPGCLEQSREEVTFDSTASTVPVCQEDSQPKGDESEGEQIAGVSLDKEEMEKIEQVAKQAVSEVILAATEEVLSGPASDVSTQSCQAAASRAERPREVAGVVSSGQMLAEKATAADENTSVRSGAVVLASPRTEERDQSVTDPSRLIHDRLSSPVQGNPKDCQKRKSVCSKSQGVDRTPVENHGGSLEKLPWVMEDSGCSTSASEGGASVEDPLQNTMLSDASGQHSDSLSLSTSRDTSAEDCSVPSGKPTLKLPDNSQVPYSNGILREDGPHLPHECSRAEGVDGDNLKAGEYLARMRSESNHRKKVILPCECWCDEEEVPGKCLHHLPLIASKDLHNLLVNLEEGSTLCYTDCTWDVTRKKPFEFVSFPARNVPGLDVTRMDFMDSGCAMRKTVARRNSKLEDKSGKFDLVIWEIEVPKTRILTARNVRQQLPAG
ncbi:A-kinase anchor protein 1, mitochondrial-like [Rhynochetos jubatus]